MNSIDYEMAKKKLTKKILIVVITIVVITFMGVTMGGDMGFGACLLMGVFGGLFLYIPLILRDYFGAGIRGTIVITLVFWMILAFLISKIQIISLIVVLVPFADIGYSAYKVLKIRKNGTNEE